MVTDPIGDLIIRIKNAGNTGKSSVSVPFSKMKLAITELLSAKGYVGDVVSKNKDEVSKSINIDLLYTKDGEPMISDVKRMSKPSRRLYQDSKSIRAFRKGFGMSVLSTPKGIMSDVDAKKNNLGGEVLFNIW
ncbi:MAG: 30S ribosomal protein S8 [Candidatus Zambryskibacteria bacterium]